MKRAAVEFLIGLQFLAIAIAIGDPPGDDPFEVSFLLVNLIVGGIVLMGFGVARAIVKLDL